MSFVVNMACGLANRMFQYSYYLYLKKQGLDVAVDYYRKAALAHENVDWEHIFPNASLPQISKLKSLIWGGGTDVFSRAFRRFVPSLTRVVQMPTAFDAYIPKQNKAYVMGVFQNASMVQEVEEEVLQAFDFAPFSEGKNKILMEEMDGCNSIGIHVRKGADYQKRIWYQGTCPLSYYHQAMEYMRRKIDKPRFYVFTDNVEWVRENFKGLDYVLVEGNPGTGWGSHFDMQLMSCCKHNIISNSTYSWWGAFLNRNVDKIVVGPKQWFNPDSCLESTSEQTLCTDWIAL